MRTCEHGACTKPAVWRSERGVKNSAHASAWCDEHVGVHPQPGDAFIVVEPIPGAQQEGKS